MRNRDRKQPKTTPTLFSLFRFFTPRASAWPRICRARLPLVMDDEAREPTPERPALSEKRKERKERKKLKQQAKVKPQPAPEQPGNSAFLARPWISLPEVNGALTKGRVRVMTWNVCPFLTQTLSVEAQLEIQLLAQCLVRTVTNTACAHQTHSR